MSDFIPLTFLGEGDGALAEVEGPRSTTSLHFRRTTLADPNAQFRILNSVEIGGGPTASGSFDKDLIASSWPALKPAELEIFQINVGKLCNMTCRHCHVDAGPDRTDENMDLETMDACIRAIDLTNAGTVDITGGAPELNPHFRYLVDECVKRGRHVIDRCNLTILTTRRFADLPHWLAEKGVEVVCSLPHYRKMSTDAQRGTGAYDKSLQALRMLNDVGYGKGDPRLRLTLVTNPVGAFLAGSQGSLEAEWKETLARNHGVSFDRLIALNNMPISRFLEWLMEKGLVEEYLQRLVNAFNPATVSGLMCRNTLSVSWDGYLYDCDFNQQLDMKMDYPGRAHVKDFDLAVWKNHVIRTERHCYGCTAGAGSSCGGQTAA
ncbi:MAG: arsenosugar biosynthesis radical SAM (seleno)protein ArsS [Rhodothermales bacterium]